MRATCVTAAAAAAVACAWGAGLAWQTAQVEEFPEVLAGLLEQNSRGELTLRHRIVSKSWFSGAEWKLTVLSDAKPWMTGSARFSPGLSPKFTFTDWKMPDPGELPLEGADPSGEMRLTAMLEPVAFDLRWKEGSGAAGTLGAGSVHVQAQSDRVHRDTGRVDWRRFVLDAGIAESVLGTEGNRIAVPASSVKILWDRDRTEAVWEMGTEPLSGKAVKSGLAFEFFRSAQQLRCAARRSGTEVVHEAAAKLVSLPGAGLLPGDFDLEFRGSVVTPWPMWMPCLLQDMVVGGSAPEVLPGACPLPEMTEASTVEKYAEALLSGKAWSDTESLTLRTHSWTLGLQGRIKFDPESGRSDPVHVVFGLTGDGQKWDSLRWGRAMVELENKGAFRRTGALQWESDLTLQRMGPEFYVLGNGVELDVVVGL